MLKLVRSHRLRSLLKEYMKEAEESVEAYRKVNEGLCENYRVNIDAQVGGRKSTHVVSRKGSANVCIEEKRTKEQSIPAI